MSRKKSEAATSAVISQAAAESDEIQKLHRETCGELAQTNAKADSILERLRRRLNQQHLHLVKP